MTSEHLISLLKVNYNNIDDLKKIQSTIECMIEAIELENELKEFQKPQIPTIKQMKQAELMDANGTSLRGHVKTTLSTLIRAFGPPNFNLGPSQYEKVTMEWVIRFSCVTIATIYDWKNYGSQPLPDEQFEWNIGGHSSKAVSLVKDQLGLMYGTGPFFDLDSRQDLHPVCKV